MKKLILTLIAAFSIVEASAQHNTSLANLPVKDITIGVDSVLCMVGIKWVKPETIDPVYGYKVWINNVLICYNEDCTLIPASNDSVITAFPASNGATYSVKIITYFYTGGSLDSGLPANITDVVTSTVVTKTISGSRCLANAELPIKTKVIKTFGQK